MNQQKKKSEFVSGLFFGFVSLFIFGIAVAGIYFCLIEFKTLMDALIKAPISTKIFWISISASCLLIYKEAFKFGKVCWEASALSFKNYKYGSYLESLN